MIFKAVCLNPDLGLIFAYSHHSGLHGWFIESGSSIKIDLANSGSGIDKGNEPVAFLSFVNSRELVLIRGSEVVVCDVTKLLDQSYSNDRNPTGDDPCVIRRISLPCRCLSMDTHDSNLIIAGEEGYIYRVDMNGKILSSFPIADSKRVIGLKVVHENSYLVGTSSELLLVNPASTNPVQSSYKLPQGTCVRHLTLDSRRNWFSAVISSNHLGSRLVVGSTKSLASVFESPLAPDADPLYVSQTNFAETSSNGLSLIGSGPTPQLLLFPLDLSSAIPRLQFNPSEDLSAVLCSQSSPKGEMIVMAGVGPSVVLVSAHSLNIVRRFSLD